MPLDGEQYNHERDNYANNMFEDEKVQYDKDNGTLLLPFSDDTEGLGLRRRQCRQQSRPLDKQPDGHGSESHKHTDHSDQHRYDRFRTGITDQRECHGGF
jgi:hypothetical protein